MADNKRTPRPESDSALLALLLTERDRRRPAGPTCGLPDCASPCHAPDARGRYCAPARCYCGGCPAYVAVPATPAQRQRAYHGPPTQPPPAVLSDPRAETRRIAVEARADYQRRETPE